MAILKEETADLLQVKEFRNYKEDSSMNEMTVNRLMAYRKGMAEVVKEQSQEAAFEDKESVKRGLGTGGGCLR